MTSPIPSVVPPATVPSSQTSGAVPRGSHSFASFLEDVKRSGPAPAAPAVQTEPPASDPSSSAAKGSSPSLSETPGKNKRGGKDAAEPVLGAVLPGDAHLADPALNLNPAFPVPSNPSYALEPPLSTGPERAFSGEQSPACPVSTGADAGQGAFLNGTTSIPPGLGEFELPANPDARETAAPGNQNGAGESDKGGAAGPSLNLSPAPATPLRMPAPTRTKGAPDESLNLAATAATVEMPSSRTHLVPRVVLSMPATSKPRAGAASDPSPRMPGVQRPGDTMPQAPTAGPEVPSDTRATAGPKAGRELPFPGQPADANLAAPAAVPIANSILPGRDWQVTAEPGASQPIVPARDASEPRASQASAKSSLSPWPATGPKDLSDARPKATQPVGTPNEEGVSAPAAPRVEGMQGIQPAAASTLPAESSHHNTAGQPGPAASDLSPLRANQEMISHPAAGMVREVHLVDGLQQSEMRIGLHTTAFGSVEVHAVVRDSQVGLAIGSERGDLRHLLSTEFPAIQGRLQREDLRLDSVRFFDQGPSFGAGLASGGQPRSQQFAYPHISRAAGLVDDASLDFPAETEFPQNPTPGLNVRA